MPLPLPYCGTLCFCLPACYYFSLTTGASVLYMCVRPESFSRAGSALCCLLPREACVSIALNLCLMLHRVPEECPQEVADVIAACRRLSPQRRPTVQEVYRSLLAAPSSPLPSSATVSPTSITPLIPDSLLP